jgi:ParB family transcriptional regulator, chromosome partitioning protein
VPPKDLRKAISQNRIANQDNTPMLGVIGTLAAEREVIEKKAEQVSVAEIEIGKLLDNPYQYLARPELDPDTLKELADSIRENGFYGSLVARPKPGNKAVYEIAYGHRRREASKLAGLKTLPVKVIDLTEEQMARIMASENFSRENLTVMGEVGVVGHFADTYNLSEAKIASAIGKTRDWVALRLAVHNAGVDIKQMVEQRPDTLGHVRLLRQITDAKKRAGLIEAVLEENLTREELTTRITELKNPPSQSLEANRKQKQDDVQTSKDVILDTNTSSSPAEQTAIVKNGTKSVQYPVREIPHNFGLMDQVHSELSTQERLELEYQAVFTRFEQSLEDLKKLGELNGGTIPAAQQPRLKTLLNELKKLL